MLKYYLPPMQRKPRIIQRNILAAKAPPGITLYRTWEEAHAALLERARKRVARDERELAAARQFLADVEAMKKGGE
ncbi:hypothetical protein [Chromobacterium haemolyticum]|uniref:hypothetical protein n=1 Tax=Chromobacterium haemolyticum TaxID=394935 RepID=UPI00307F37D0